MAHRRVVLLPFVLALAFGSGCGAFGTGPSAADGDGLLAEVPESDDDAGGSAYELLCQAEPGSVVIEGDEVDTVLLSASVRAPDGSEEPAEGVQWTVLDDFGGTVDGDGRYSPPTTHGGRVEIEATSGDLTALCAVELYLWLDYQDPSAGSVDPSLVDLEPSISDDCGPDLVYPLSGTTLARDLGAPTIQWLPPTNLDVFVLTIENEFTSLSVLTTELSFRPTVTQWTALAHAAGGEQLSVSVAGGLLVSGGSGVVSGLCQDSQGLGASVSAFGVGGTVYYWSPTTSGLWSIGVGAEGAQSWVGTESTGYCVGCHTVNLSNPGRMAMVYGGGNGSAVAMDVSAPDSPILAPETRMGNFTALSPDGARLIRSYEGQLYLDDLQTNSIIGTLPSTGHATHVDWAPDGSMVVYASCTDSHENFDWQVWGCGIRSVDVLDGDQFGPETIIVPNDPDWNYYYPTVSPDGNWVAFNRHSGGDPDRSAYANSDAQLMLVPAWGGEPILLSSASLPGQTNSWPRWGPSEGDYAWLTFSSKRPYGWITHNVSQIWMTAVDFNEAVQGQDPSSPPMWLPSQDTQTGNHRPVWVPRY